MVEDEVRRPLPLPRDISGAAMDRRVPVPSWRRWGRRAAIIVAFAGMAAASWSLFVGERGYSIALSQVQVHEAKLLQFEDAVPVRGQVVPRTSTLVEAALPGTVEAVLTDEGAHVEPGQPLMRLRNPTLELQTSEREAVLMQQLTETLHARAQLERDRQAADRLLAEVAFKAHTTRGELEKQEMLFRSGFVSDLLLERFRDDSRFAAEQHAQLRSDRERSRQLAERQAKQLDDLAPRIRSALADARRALDGLTLRAPAAGVLSGSLPKAGQRLDVGARVAQIDGDGDIKVVGTIDEFYLPRVAAGQPAESATAGGSKLTVVKVLPQVTAGRFTVELEFRGVQPPNLRRGQSVEARLLLSAPALALVLPNAAFMADSGGAYVYLVDAAGDSARKVPVRIGRKNTTWVEVLEGLKPGDRVVTSTYAPFKEQALLKFTSG